MVAFFVKCGGSVAEVVHSADNYAPVVFGRRNLGFGRQNGATVLADTPKREDYRGKGKITSLAAKGPLTPSMGRIKVGWGKIR